MIRIFNVIFVTYREILFYKKETFGVKLRVIIFKNLVLWPVYTLKDSHVCCYIM